MNLEPETKPSNPTQAQLHAELLSRGWWDSGKSEYHHLTVGNYREAGLALLRGGLWATPEWPSHNIEHSLEEKNGCISVVCKICEKQESPNGLEPGCEIARFSNAHDASIFSFTMIRKKVTLAGFDITPDEKRP